MIKTIFTGTATALITPFDESGKDVDYKSFEKLVEFQIANSIDALVVAGTTGESPVLTTEEKIEMIKIAKCIGNATPVIAGTGSNNTEDAVRKSNEAEKQGVNGLLIVTPYYNKCTQDGIIKHYSYISDRVSAPIIVYNVPSRTGVNIQSETYEALSEIKNIAAVKEASGNISEFNKAVAQSGDKLDFYSGNDDLTVSMMSYGAKGVISVASNIIPAIMKEISELCLANSFEKASFLHKKYLRLMNALFCEVNPAPVKFACSQLIGLNNTLRLPLTNICKSNEIKLSNLLREFELIK